MHPWISRRLVHPLLFRTRGEPVAAGLADLTASATAPPAALVAAQLSAFRTVAAAGAERFPFYREMLAAAGVSPQRVSAPADLQDWPLLDKSHLNRAVRELRSGEGARPPHTVRLSGGSSGEPSVVLADRRTTGRSLAARILCQGWHGLRPGDRQIRFWGRPLPRGAWREHLKDQVLNRIRLDSEAIGPEALPATVARIRRFGAEYLYGYASLVRLFIQALDEEQAAGIRAAGLKAVISTSEVLPEAQRTELGARLGVPVVDEYGCSEVDIIAFGCARGRRHVIAGNVLLEVVRQGDEPEGYGRAVVTDLTNTLMPVIRYQLGDLVPLAPESCDCGCRWPCIGPVLGRVQDQFILLEDGRRKVHSQFVVYLIEQLVDEGWDLGRFQIVQEREDLMSLLVTRGKGGGPDAEGLRRRLQEAGAGTLGPEVAWQVRVVAPAELATVASGKFRHFVCRLTEPA
jgi:phenylacetate-CoA ligase